MLIFRARMVIVIASAEWICRQRIPSISVYRWRICVILRQQRSVPERCAAADHGPDAQRNFPMPVPLRFQSPCVPDDERSAGDLNEDGALTVLPEEGVRLYEALIQCGLSRRDIGSLGDDDIAGFTTELRIGAHVGRTAGGK